MVTFRDPTQNTARKLQDIFIIDMDNALSLIYDSSNQLTELGTINFQNPSISYQRAFP